MAPLFDQWFDVVRIMFVFFKEPKITTSIESNFIKWRILNYIDNFNQ